MINPFQQNVEVFWEHFGLFATSVYCTLYMYQPVQLQLFDSNEPTGMVNEQLNCAVLSDFLNQDLS